MSDENSRSNWSATDACLLVQLYEPYHALIAGTVRVTNISRSRETSWKKVFDRFNSSGPDEVRTEKQIRAKIANIKESARKHGSAVRFNKTGGGPPPPPVPVYVLKMYELQGGEGNAGLVGIGSLMESGTGKGKKAASVLAENAGCPEEEEYDEEEEEAARSVKCSAIALGGCNGRPLSVPPKSEVVCTPPLSTPPLQKKCRLNLGLSTSSQSDSLQQRLLDEQRALIRENRELIEVQKELASNQNQLTIEQNELAADQRQIAWLQNIKLKRQLVEKGFRFRANDEGREEVISPEGELN